MIAGTSTADVVLLVVDASKGGFELGILSSQYGKTMEYALIAN